MSNYIYQYYEAAISIDGTSQDLVQSVGVKSDAGLDFVSIPTTGVGIPIIKPNIISQIDIEYIGYGTLVDPLYQPLHDTFGDIILHRFNGNSITFKKCILVGTSSSIDANDVYGKKTLTYQSIGGYSVGGTSWPIDYPSTGTIKSYTRPCFESDMDSSEASEYSGYVLAFKSNCTINREPLYSQGRGAPTHLCIKYPIQTTSTVTRIENNSTDLPNKLSKLCVGDGQDGPLMQKISGLYAGYLDDYSIEGIQVGGSRQVISFNFLSTFDYGLKRLVEYTPP